MIESTLGLTLGGTNKLTQLIYFFILLVVAVHHHHRHHHLLDNDDDDDDDVTKQRATLGVKNCEG